MLFALLGRSESSFVVQENLVFKKIADVTTSHQHWTVTLIVETKQYDTALDTILRKIAYTEEIVKLAKPALVRNLHSHLIGHKENLHWFSLLSNSIDELRIKCENIKTQLTKFRNLQSRKKRSLLPFVGGALSFLFGSVSEDELERISENVRKLEQNQLSIMHVLKENISLLNATRIAVSDNREKINEVILAISSVENRVSKISEILTKEIIGLEAFIETYFKLDHIIRELSEQTDTVSEHIQDLGWKINSLALGRLTPNIITPKCLQSILIQIQTKLDPTQGLPEDPVENLWKFYEFLTSKTVMQDKRILIVITVPILEHANEYEIYKVINLPLPLRNGKMSTVQDGLTAHYSVEAHALAIDRERTKFVMLTDHELEACSKEVLKFCAINSPVYFVNKNALCVTSLFFGKRDMINRNCKSIVKTSVKLPQATHVSKGKWAISTRTPLQFSIVCRHRDPFTVTARPPLSIVILDRNCAAFNDFLSLPANIEKRKTFDVTENLPETLFSKWENGNFSVLNPIISNFGNLSKIKIPTQLKSLTEISMDHLVQELKHTYQLSIPKATKSHLWMYLVSATFGILTLIVIVLALWLLKRRRITKPCTNKPKDVKLEDNPLIKPSCSVKFDAGSEEINLEF